MGDYTTRYALYLPGGGSSGTITPDEVVDIDKINDNFRKIDSALGIADVADANLPASPGLWQTVHATTTDNLVKWNGSAWVNVLPARLSAGNMSSTYYSKTDFAPTSGAGALDGRYYTQSQLVSGGALDSVYPNRNAPGVVTQKMLQFKILSGSGLMQNLALDGTTNTYNKYQDITFSPAFTNTPQVVATANSSDSGGVTCQYVNLTNTGVRIYLNRRNQADTGFSWIAIGT